MTREVFEEVKPFGVAHCIYQGSSRASNQIKMLKGIEK